MTEENTEAPQPPKRRRGRPRKAQAGEEQQANGASRQAGGEAQAPKRRRGRPRKSQAAEEGQSQTPAQQQERAQQPHEQGEQRERDRAQHAQATQRANQFRQQARPGRGQYQQNRFQQAQASRRRNRHGAYNAGNGNQNATEPRLSREALTSMRVAELRVHAADLGVEYVGVRKGELVEAVYVAAARAEGFHSTSGVLDITGEGYGFVRTGNYMQGEDDAFVPQQLIKHLGLRRGDWVEGTVRPSRPNDKYPALQKVASVNGLPPETIRDRPRFRDLTPVYPNERLTMEHGRDSITGRAIDLVAPIGKGQRGLIVSPPKAGKTTVLKRICESIAAKLDRELADKRIFPAIDPVVSGTRNEELLIDPELQPFVWGIRRILANMNNTERAEASLIKGLRGTNDNQEFLIRSAKKAQQSEYADAL